MINLSYAKAVVVGRLTRDPELNQTNSGKAVVNFSLAVNRRFSKDDTTDFFDATAWGKTAELIAAHKKKGDQVLIEGDLQVDTWEQDGTKRSKVKIVAQSVVFLASKGENASSNNSNSNGVDDQYDDIPF